MFDFFRILIRFFEENKIPYMLSGSVAMSIYTLPRFTRDFDFVVHLETENVNAFKDFFQVGYYCNEDAIREAIHNKGIFNIIDHKSNYKADFVVLNDEPYRRTEFDRRRQIDFLDMNVYIVSSEDLLLSKLIWIQDIQSALQMEDIKALQAIPELDWTYIRGWLGMLKLNTFGLLNND